MLNWSNNKLKLTSGIGTLGMTGCLSSLSDYHILPFWIVLFISLFPLIVFLMIKPDEFFSKRVVIISHLFASLFFLLSFALSIFFSFKILPLKELTLYSVFMSFGLIPCLIVVYRFWLFFRYSKGLKNENKI